VRDSVGMNSRILFSCALASVSLSTVAQADKAAFLGRWALTIPGGGAGWLSVTQEKGYYDASILWGGGSVVPVDSVFFSDEDTLVVTRVREVKREDANGKEVKKHRFTEAVMAKADGDVLSLTRMNPHDDGSGIDRETFEGKRIPALPPAPDLSKVKFGEGQTLFKGEADLAQWELVNPKNDSGWSVKDGVLMNRAVQEEGKSHKHYGNLRTKAEFEDFNLTLGVRVPKGGNSGIYLRGIYEIQVADTSDKGLNAHHMGGIYSRVAPSVKAEKPVGEWQTYDITLVDRHVTVKLNGVTIHDNVALQGCTGGALWSDEMRPGPFYLQGDHTDVDYRNIVVRPVVK
jgi:hypothetical protein